MRTAERVSMRTVERKSLSTAGQVSVRTLDTAIQKRMCSLELQRMFENSNIIRLRFSRTNFFLRTNVH